MSKGLLITGATGKQGGATVDALVAAPSNATSDFTILAVTRSANSAAAQALVSKAPNIKVVQGDMNDVPALFSAAKAAHPTGSIWGVFSVQVPGGKGQSVVTEETQGKALVDAAVAAGVKQFVYTSVDRGGDVSLRTPTNVPHFISKHRIEEHLVAATSAPGSEMAHTILRPVFFIDNLTPGFFGKMIATAWKVALPADKPLQVVAVSDIGHFAAQAFLHPEKNRNRGISLAGDELTYAQMDGLFKDKTGLPAPTTYDFMAKAMLWGVKDVGLMFQFFKNAGYGANVPALKKEHPGLVSLSSWIDKQDAFAKK